MAVLERVDAGFSGTEICAEFGIKFKTFFYIMKNQKKIRADAKAIQNPVNASKVNKTNKTQSNYAFLDAEVFRWYQQECAAGVHVSGDDLQRFAAQLAKYSNITDFKASDHWLSKFQKQYNLDDFRAAGPSASADKTAVDPFSEEMHGVIFPPNHHGKWHYVSYFMWCCVYCVYYFMSGEGGGQGSLRLFHINCNFNSKGRANLRRFHCAVCSKCP